MKETPIEQFHLLLKKLLEEGNGEVVYRIVVKDSKILYYSLNKLNTYKPDSDIMKV